MQAVLLALAKQEPGKIDSYYKAQIKPYTEYFAEGEGKAEAFAFCRERMEGDITSEAPRLKEMSRELSERRRRFGGAGAKQLALGNAALSHIHLARIANRLLRPSQVRWTELWKEAEGFQGNKL